VTLPVMIAEP